ncbi:MAG: DUF1634 domain-containing protein [Armatimonadota bacterium]|jgi:uncharacterized membrane protein
MRIKLDLSDEQIEQVIGNLLRFGVLLAAAVVFMGGVVFLTRHHASPSYHIFRGEPRSLRRVPEIARLAFSFSGRGLIQLGVLLLIAVPVVRVALSLLAFIIQRDRIYVVVTLVVLSVLLYSLFWTR